MLGLATLLYSGQRAGTLSGILSLFPLILLTLKKKYFWSASLFFAVLFFISAIIFSLSSPEKIDFIRNRYSFDSGLSNREWIWQNAFSQIMENPLLGYGVGASEIMIRSSFHNAYLEIWFNTGLLGLLFYLGAQCYFLYRIWYLLRQPLDLETKSVIVLSLGYIIGFIFVCLFESVGASASTMNLMIYVFVGSYVSNKELFPKIVMNFGNKILLSRQKVVW
jgi:O-antigen ligase